MVSGALWCTPVRAGVVRPYHLQQVCAWRMHVCLIHGLHDSSTFRSCSTIQLSTDPAHMWFTTPRGDATRLARQILVQQWYSVGPISASSGASHGLPHPSPLQEPQQRVTCRRGRCMAWDSSHGGYAWCMHECHDGMPARLQALAQPSGAAAPGLHLAAQKPSRAGCDHSHGDWPMRPVCFKSSKLADSDGRTADGFC